jgi:peptidyl-prolyl cis-trans isomerase C
MARFRNCLVFSRGHGTALRCLALGSVFMTSLLMGCSRSDEPVVLAQPDVAPTQLARVGDRILTPDDLVREANRRREAGLPVPEKAALLKQMIEHSALLQQAIASGVDMDAALQRDVDDLMIARWRDRDIEARLAAQTIDDAELEKAYVSRQADYVTPANIRLAILKLGASPRMSEERQAELEGRLTEARQKIIANPAPGGRGPAGMGFGALAIDYSDDAASRYRGGDIGWLEEGNFQYRWPRNVLETGYALEKNVPSSIVKEANAYYLVMKTDARPGSTKTLETVRGALRRQLLIERQNRIRLSIHQEAMRAFPASIDEKQLQQVTLPEAYETAYHVSADKTSVLSKVSRGSE